jgi:transcriptional regulator with GAF, ATPase, and Fis domain
MQMGTGFAGIIGDSNPIRASTNRFLEEEVRNGKFRMDLFYRPNVFPITIPPLRQRREDIPLLVKFFADKFSRDHSKRITGIPQKSMTALQQYNWPGNVRELMTVVERAVIISEGPVLQLVEQLNNLPGSGAGCGGLKKPPEIQNRPARRRRPRRLQ